MSTVTVRGLDPEVVSGLKALSAQHGRSMEAEVRWVLGRYVADTEFPTADVVREFDGDPGTHGGPENWVTRFRRQLAERGGLVDDEFAERLEQNRRESARADRGIPDFSGPEFDR